MTRSSPSSGWAGSLSPPQFPLLLSSRSVVAERCCHCRWRHALRAARAVRSRTDGDTNGGVDKPGCTGGVDATDRDGNNGCGNDADREDDNNGNCGGDGTAADEPAQPEDGDDVTVTPETVEGDVNVQSAAAASESGTPATEASSTNAADPAAVTAADNATPAADTTTPETQVLGETLTAPTPCPAPAPPSAVSPSSVACWSAVAASRPRPQAPAHRLTGEAHPRQGMNARRRRPTGSAG